MKLAITTLALAAALTAGCDNGPSAAPGSSAAPAAAVSDDDLAVPADFEDEAERSINADNYKGELDALAKEVETE